MKPFEGKDIKGLSKKIEQLFGVTGDKIQQICNDTLKIYKPKDKKDIQYSGQSITISLIEDGRIMLQFPTTTSSEYYWNNIPTITEEKSENLCISAKQEGLDIGYKIANETWLNKRWYKRLFTSWQ